MVKLPLLLSILHCPQFSVLGPDAREDGYEITYNVQETRRIVGGVNTLVGTNEGSVVSIRNSFYYRMARTRFGPLKEVINALKILIQYNFNSSS